MLFQIEDWRDVLFGVLLGIPIGLAIVFPWRETIRARVRAGNIEVLTNRLHEAIEKMEKDSGRPYVVSDWSGVVDHE